MPFKFPEPPTLYRPVRRVIWDNGNPVSKKTLLIGMNPAETGETPTVGAYLKKLTAFLDSKGYGAYNDFTLMNLFSHVSKDPEKVDLKSATDFRQYRDLLADADMILLTWGIRSHKHVEQKRAALEVLKDYEPKVYCIERQGRGPVHPSDRLGLNNAEIVKVNILSVYAMAMDLNRKL